MIRSFARGVLIGTACICLLALGWLFLFRPSLAQYEASELKEAFTESDPGGNSGVLSLPWFNAENEKQLDLASLQAQYPDVQAWLSIPGTRVDYPVLQSSMENPEYYLRRNYKGEWRTAGSLFLQSDCRLSGKTLIVYAHNMNDGSMFGCLPRYLGSGYCSKHSQIQLQTPDGTWQYTVVAALETDVSQVPFNMRVLIVEPGQYPREADIDGSLDTLQHIVGGLIETLYPWEDRAVLICNDEGKLMGLPLNRSLEDYDIIAGTFFICGLGDEDFCSLTEAQMEHYKSKYRMPELFFKTPDGVKGKPCSPSVYRLFMGQPERQRSEAEHER